MSESWPSLDLFLMLLIISSTVGHSEIITLRERSSFGDQLSMTDLRKSDIIVSFVTSRFQVLDIAALSDPPFSIMNIILF